ncbi:MAG: 4-hydroxythreonine-4-phosphate dehydrogenase PdxA [Thermoproteota archaeon]
MSRKPVIGITMGDAPGIGPEIVVKCLLDKEVYELCNPIVIGSAGVIEDATSKFCDMLKVRSVNRVADASFQFGTIDVLDLDNLVPKDFHPGEISAKAGKASIEYIKEAVRLALSGMIDAIATAPINKEAVKRAGYEYAGHTELLAQLTNCKDYAMMLVSGQLRVVHVSTHVSLIEACKEVKRQNILKTILLTNRSMQSLGFRSPKIAVAGMNPHAGEGGLFGEEEIREISPAIFDARARGVNVSGPYPADTVFLRASRGEFDVVVAMFHDQGHIAVKMLGFEEGINITLGLPVIRTSVDHGTAYDIAWKGFADPRSMKKAVLTAVEMTFRKANASTA